MFVRRLVNGVRSSCEASATSWRWTARDRSSASINRIIVFAAWIVLGATFGFGTILYAVSIGPLVQVFLPRFTVTERAPSAAPLDPAPADTLAA